MKLFLLSLDVSEARVEEVESLIKGAKSWWHYLEKVWIIATEKSLEEWKIAVRNKIDDSDSFLIVDITGMDRNGWLPKRAWSWLRERNDACKMNSSEGVKSSAGSEG